MNNRNNNGDNVSNDNNIDMEVAAAGVLGNTIDGANSNARFVKETRAPGVPGSVIKLTDINALRETLSFKIFVKLVDTTGVVIFGPANLKILIDALQDSGIIYSCDQTLRSICIKVDSEIDRTNLINSIKSKLDTELHGYISVNGLGKLSNRFVILNLKKNLFITRVNVMSMQNAYSRSIVDELDNAMENAIPHEDWFSVPFIFGNKAILLVHNQEVTKKLVENPIVRVRFIIINYIYNHPDNFKKKRLKRKKVSIKLPSTKNGKAIKKFLFLFLFSLRSSLHFKTVVKYYLT